LQPGELPWHCTGHIQWRKRKIIEFLSDFLTPTSGDGCMAKLIALVVHISVAGARSPIFRLAWLARGEDFPGSSNGARTEGANQFKHTK